MGRPEGFTLPLNLGEEEKKREREREGEKEREREKCCTFEGVIPLHHSPGERRKKVLHLCGGPVSPLCIGGEARGCLEAVPSVAFPSGA